MKKLSKILSSAIFRLVVIYIVEIILTVLLILHVNGLLIKQYTWIENIFYALKILTLIMLVYVLLHEKMDYAYRINWLVLFFISPTFGGLLYVLCANQRPFPKKWRKSYRRRRDYKEEINFKESKKSKVNRSQLENEDPNLARTASYIAENIGTSLYSETESKFFSKGEDAWDEIIKALENAKYYILIEYYIIAEGVLWKRVEDVLLKKAKEGVTIKILYDDMGTIGRLSIKTIRNLIKNKIDVAPFNRVKLHLDYSLNFRNHRKIVVVDGYVGFTGGINLADEYINVNSPYGHWFDTGVMIKGKAVDDAVEVFTHDWEFATGKSFALPEIERCNDIHPSGYHEFFIASPFDDIPLARNVLLSMLGNAKKYFYISTPYVALDEATLQALILAANSGIDVRIVVPGIPDKKIVYTITQSYFKTLLENNVKIYTYTPGFLHAKLLLADGNVATVGSVNIDYRSFYLNFECGTALFNTDSITDVKRTFDELFEKSRQVTEFKESLWFKIKRMAIRFIIPLC